MKRKNITVSEANYVELRPKWKTVVIRYYINIKGQLVVAVLDSEAAISIITKKLMKKLGQESIKTQKQLLLLLIELEKKL